MFMALIQPQELLSMWKVWLGQNPQYHFYEVALWDKEDVLKFFVPKNPDHVSHALAEPPKNKRLYIS